MKISVCIATRNHGHLIGATLESIFGQRLDNGQSLEVIVVDDGSSDQTAEECRRFPVRYTRLETPAVRNPGPARNIAMKQASGDVLVLQSDEVVHDGDRVISGLIEKLQDDCMVFATVYDSPDYKNKVRGMLYTGTGRQKPWFFLGVIRRESICAVGGNEELFDAPGYEDKWLGVCLARKAGLRSVFSETELAYHQSHGREAGWKSRYSAMSNLYSTLINKANAGSWPFCASGGPWPYVPGDPVIPPPEPFPASQ